MPPEIFKMSEHYGNVQSKNALSIIQFTDTSGVILVVLCMLLLNAFLGKKTAGTFFNVYCGDNHVLISWKVCSNS